MIDEKIKARLIGSFGNEGEVAALDELHSRLGEADRKLMDRLCSSTITWHDFTFKRREFFEWAQEHCDLAFRHECFRRAALRDTEIRELNNFIAAQDRAHNKQLDELYALLNYFKVSADMPEDILLRMIKAQADGLVRQILIPPASEATS